MDKKNINAAQSLIQSLEKCGVEYIFGYPGGAAMPIFDALYDSSIQLILVRHEQGATHMADGMHVQQESLALFWSPVGPVQPTL